MTGPTVGEAWANVAGLAAEVERDTTHEGCVEDAARALALAVLAAADVGFDEEVGGAADGCTKCTWDSGPYSKPCEEHSQLGALRAEIEALGR